MSTLSTQVIDTSLGVAVSGLPIAIERHDGERWTHLSGTTTNEDGSVTDILPDDVHLERGTYRLTFDTGTYFAVNNQTCFYPVVRIVFEVLHHDEHHHLPLMLSTYGYSTYRTTTRSS